MLSDRRRFTARERAALFAVAGGLCEECGTELVKGWHADHVVPWSLGGATDVVNGAALCGPCNLRKGNRMEDPRSKWQHTAVERFKGTGGDYLITACPGSGKTRAALSIARAMFDAGRADRLIVVVPTRRLKTQWREAAHQFGLDITTEDELPRDVDGTVITYARLANNPLFYRTLVAQRKTLVVLDEVHHASEEDHTSWGPALRDAFEPAERRLLLSGTPFRSDGRPIPFVTYDGNGMAVSDSSFGYGQAVSNGVCRPLRFEVMDGRGEWLRGTARVVAAAKESSEADRAGLLGALYKPDGDWLASVLREADAELSRMREEKPDAGGLLVAPGIEMAKAYARLLHSITGEAPAVAHSEDQDADRIIDAYAQGRSRWLVSVAMVSEGVDIPRLSVLVFASKVRTEMWFRQVMGRIVRMDATGTITATAFIPEVPDLVAMANRIESEAEAGLREQVERLEREAGQREFEFDLTVPLGSSAAVRSQVIESGSAIPAEELARARELRQQVGGSMAGVHDADLVKAMRLLGAAKVTGTVRVPDVPAQSGDQLRKALKQQVGQRVRSYAFHSGREYAHVHGELNRLCGDTLAKATVETLHMRLEILVRWGG